MNNSESKKDRMRSTSLDSAVVPVSKQSKQSIQGHTPIQKTHSSDSILRIPSMNYFFYLFKAYIF